MLPVCAFELELIEGGLARLFAAFPDPDISPLVVAQAISRKGIKAVTNFFM
jgi:hypothetical protein